MVSRFATYAVEMDPVSTNYSEAMRAWPDFEDWRAAAERETAVNPGYDL